MTREQTNIDQLMLDKGIKTDKALAKKMGLSSSGLFHRLNTNNITLRTLEQLSKIFDVTVKDLIK